MSTLALQPRSFLDYAVGAIGVISFAHAYMAWVNPNKISKGFNMDVKTPEGQQVCRDIFALYAARDIALGFGMGSAAYYGHKGIMGWSMAGLAVMTTIDGFVSKRGMEGGQWKHWIFTVLPVGLAAGCFGAFN